MGQKETEGEKRLEIILYEKHSEREKGDREGEFYTAFLFNKREKEGEK